MECGECCSRGFHIVPSILTPFGTRDMRSAPRDVEDFEFDAAPGPIWNRFTVLHHFPCETCRPRYFLSSGVSLLKTSNYYKYPCASAPNLLSNLQNIQISDILFSNIKKRRNSSPVGKTHANRHIMRLTFICAYFRFHRLPSNDECV